MVFRTTMMTRCALVVLCLVVPTLGFSFTPKLTPNLMDTLEGPSNPFSGSTPTAGSSFGAPNPVEGIIINLPGQDEGEEALSPPPALKESLVANRKKTQQTETLSEESTDRLTVLNVTLNELVEKMVGVSPCDCTSPPSDADTFASLQSKFHSFQSSCTNQEALTNVQTLFNELQAQVSGIDQSFDTTEVAALLEDFQNTKINVEDIVYENNNQYASAESVDALTELVNGLQLTFDTAQAQKDTCLEPCRGWTDSGSTDETFAAVQDAYNNLKQQVESVDVATLDANVNSLGNTITSLKELKSHWQEQYEAMVTDYAVHGTSKDSLNDQLTNLITSYNNVQGSGVSGAEGEELAAGLAEKKSRMESLTSGDHEARLQGLITSLSTDLTESLNSLEDTIENERLSLSAVKDKDSEIASTQSSIPDLGALNTQAVNTAAQVTNMENSASSVEQNEVGSLKSDIEAATIRANNLNSLQQRESTLISEFEYIDDMIEDLQPANCPSEFKYLADVNICIYLNTVTSNWYEANSACKMIAGQTGRLVVIDTEQKRLAIAGYLESIYDYNEYLIGLYAMRVDDYWYYTETKLTWMDRWEAMDTSGWTGPQWNPGEPAQSGNLCGNLWNKKLDDVYCMDHLVKSICEYPLE